MAPKNSAVRGGGYPTVFLRRVLELPAVAETVDIAQGMYIKTKGSNEFVGNALKATEDGIWRAAEGAMPLATNMTTPIMNSVGGWTKVDEWACKGLDQVEKAAPIIKKPTKEIVTTTRHFVLSVVAGDLKANPKNLQIAFQTRMENTNAFLTNNQVYKMTAKFADQSLENIHVFVLQYHTPRKENEGAWKKAGVMLKTLLLVQEVGDMVYARIVQQIPVVQDRANKTQLALYQDSRREWLRRKRQRRKTEIAANITYNTNHDDKKHSITDTITENSTSEAEKELVSILKVKTYTPVYKRYEIADKSLQQNFKTSAENILETASLAVQKKIIIPNLDRQNSDSHSMQPEKRDLLTAQEAMKEIPKEKEIYPDPLENCTNKYNDQTKKTKLSIMEKEALDSKASLKERIFQLKTDIDKQIEKKNTRERAMKHKHAEEKELQNEAVSKNLINIDDDLYKDGIEKVLEEKKDKTQTHAYLARVLQRNKISLKEQELDTSTYKQKESKNLTTENVERHNLITDTDKQRKITLSAYLHDTSANIKKHVRSEKDSLSDSESLEVTKCTKTTDQEVLKCNENYVTSPYFVDQLSPKMSIENKPKSESFTQRRKIKLLPLNLETEDDMYTEDKQNISLMGKLRENPSLVSHRRISLPPKHPKISKNHDIKCSNDLDDQKLAISIKKNYENISLSSWSQKEIVQLTDDDINYQKSVPNKPNKKDTLRKKIIIKSDAMDVEGDQISKHSVRKNIAIFEGAKKSNTDRSSGRFSLKSDLLDISNENTTSLTLNQTCTNKSKLNKQESTFIRYLPRKEYSAVQRDTNSSNPFYRSTVIYQSHKDTNKLENNRLSRTVTETSDPPQNNRVHQLVSRLEARVGKAAAGLINRMQDK